MEDNGSDAVPDGVYIMCEAGGISSEMQTAAKNARRIGSRANIVQRLTEANMIHWRFIGISRIGLAVFQDLIEAIQLALCVKMPFYEDAEDCVANSSLLIPKSIRRAVPNYYLETVCYRPLQHKITWSRVCTLPEVIPWPWYKRFSSHLNNTASLKISGKKY